MKSPAPGQLRHCYWCHVTVHGCIWIHFSKDSLLKKLQTTHALIRQARPSQWWVNLYQNGCVIKVGSNGPELQPNFKMRVQGYVIGRKQWGSECRWDTGKAAYLPRSRKGMWSSSMLAPYCGRCWNILWSPRRLPFCRRSFSIRAIRLKWCCVFRCGRNSDHSPFKLDKVIWTVLNRTTEMETIKWTCSRSNWSHFSCWWSLAMDGLSTCAS